MTDYSEDLVLLQPLVRKLEESLRFKDYGQAIDTMTDIEDHISNIRMWIVDNA